MKRKKKSYGRTQPLNLNTITRQYRVVLCCVACVWSHTYNTEANKEGRNMITLIGYRAKPNCVEEIK